MTAVADIDPEPTIDRLAGDGMQLAMLVDEPAGMAREGMGQDVARPHQLYDLGQDVVGIDAVGAAPLAVASGRSQS